MNKNSSLISNFKNNSITAVIVTALAIAVSIIALEYQEFIETSAKLEREYITSQKELIQNEVTRISFYINNKRSHIKSILKRRIQQRVYDAHTIASNIYLQHHKEWPEEKIKESIKAALRGLRFFNGDGYYFAHSLQGDLQLHGLKPESEGKNRLNVRDSKGQYIVKNFINIINKEKEGFLSYTYASFSQPDVEREKLVFVKHFKPYNWMIGTGDYAENIEKIIQTEVLDYIEQIRFGKDGFIFVVNYQGTVVMSPTQKHLIGKNIWNLEDPNGVKVIQEERRAVEKPEGGFIYYSWNKPSTSAPSPKVSFMKGIEDWQWMIGAGLYLDDVDGTITELKESLKSQTLTKLFTLLSLSFLAVIFIITKTQHTSKRINKEQDQFITFFKNLSINSKKIELESLHFTEFKDLAKSANRMLEKQKTIETDNKNIETQLRQSQKMEALGNIVGGIAHDFNNLLGIMMGYSELLANSLNKNDKNQTYATRILEATKRGSNLTKKLLGISRDKEQIVNSLDLNQLLIDNKEILQKTITARVLLDYHLEKNISPIFVDSSDLNDSLLNICINAMHAMADTKNPILTLKTSHIILSTEHAARHGVNPGEFITLTITDNGSGIDELIIEHIFEPFFTTKGDYGTGLGLSQVYAFMKRCNGSIEIDSTLDLGTSISLLFPVTKPTAKHNLPGYIKSNQELSIGGSETILIVDDEPSITQLGSEVLQAHGYKVIQAESGKKALDILKNQHVDLLISDMIMPEMGGDELVGIVKERYPDLPIQLVSGYSDQYTLQKLEPELYNEILLKPFEALALLQHIRILLNQKADQCPSA